MLFDVFDHLSRRGCLHWTRETTGSVVSQGCSYGLCKCKAPVSSSWLLVKSTEGMCSGNYGRTQKQGSAEAGPVGSKSGLFARVPIHSIPLNLAFVK